MAAYKQLLSIARASPHRKRPRLRPLLAWVGSSSMGRQRCSLGLSLRCCCGALLELSSATPFMTLLQLLFPHLPILRDSFRGCYGLWEAAENAAAAATAAAKRRSHHAMALRAWHSASAHRHKKNTDYFKSAGGTRPSRGPSFQVVPELPHHYIPSLQQKKGRKRLSFTCCYWYRRAC